VASGTDSPIQRDRGLIPHPNPEEVADGFLTPASLKTQRHQDPFFGDEPRAQDASERPASLDLKAGCPHPAGMAMRRVGSRGLQLAAFPPLRLRASARKLPPKITQPRTDLARRRRGAERTDRLRSGSSSRPSRLRVRHVPFRAPAAAFRCGAPTDGSPRRQPWVRIQL
jgi:hypothetical protein